MKKIALLAIACFLLIVAFVFFNQQKIVNAPFFNSQEQLSQGEKKNLVQEYLKNNISQISPQKEVLGGKFYITSLDIQPEDKAIVGYEDGHIVVKASFNFEIKDNSVIIKNFIIFPQEDLKKESIKNQEILNFDQCVKAGYAIMESYPRQCKIPDGKIFVEGE